jgi:beta-phosphoglucomutase
MLLAVIFDFDGVIVDTEPIHFQAFQGVLEPLGLGYDWEEYMERYIGFDDRDAFRERYRMAGKVLCDLELGELIERKASFFENIVKKGVKPYPGVVPLISALSGSIPLGLCSGALRRDIDPILEQIGLTNSFAAMVTADEVKASKPDPESYQVVVNRLSAAFPDSRLSPSGCVAIEDTPAGTKSAVGAGLRVLAVTNSYKAERLSGATLITDSLDSVTLSVLGEMVKK